MNCGHGTVAPGGQAAEDHAVAGAGAPWHVGRPALHVGQPEHGEQHGFLGVFGEAEGARWLERIGGAECGAQLTPGAKFCPECGTKTAG